MIWYRFISLFIIINSFIFSFFIIIKKNHNNNVFRNMNITELIINNLNLNNNECRFIKNELKKRNNPFDFENEFFFFASLILCKIPFSFIRFGDGEEYIMRGKDIGSKMDKWHWNPKNLQLRNSLIESSSICTSYNNFIGIPCKNWIKISKSILSYSKCSSAKYMSYATLFINKNFQNFKNWVLWFINSANRWKIILVANQVINANISWAYKFYSVPDHIIENWENYSISLLSKLSKEAKHSHLLFFVSAGPAANIIISFLSKINNKNIYIDFGSSIEFITKGYSTRSYSYNNSKYANQKCEPFLFVNKNLVYK